MPTSFEQSLDLLARKSVLRMTLFLWGFVWLLMSVVIYVVGRLVSQLQPRPPPPALKPRLPRRSAPASPIISPPEPILAEPDDIASFKSLSSAPAQLEVPPPSPSAPTKRSFQKKKWSFSTWRLFSRRPAPSPKSSLFSDGSATLVGSPPSPRFFPELPVVESASPSTELSFEQEAPGSSRSSPSSSPRIGRGARLPGVKLFKSLSRKVSAKQKSDSSLNLLGSPKTPEGKLRSREGSVASDDETGIHMPRRASTSEVPRRARPGHLLHERNLSLPGEVFATSFVNPFRSKSRKPKTPPAIDLSDPVSPSPRRAFTSRKMLTSFQLAISGSSGTGSQPHTQSRRSSISSTSTAVSVFSAPSVLSTSSGSPRSVPRTQPYAAPYYAAMPLSPRSASTADGQRPKPRRTSSLSPPRRPETVAEESAEEQPPEPDANLSALGLKLGQLGHGRPRRAPRESRQRVAVSEGAVDVGAIGGLALN